MMATENLRGMSTDYHSHILPGIDDGAADAATSFQMLQASAQQGVKRQILTPHFYQHREISVSDFLQKRQRAYDQITAQTDVMEMRLGAEVAMEIDISKCKDIEQLAIAGTRLILLEPSYYGFRRTMLDDIYHFERHYGLKPVLAHLHRYIRIYDKAALDQLMSLDAIFQVNVEAFADRKERKVVKTLLENGKEVIFGTDCHNMLDRPPNWEQLQKPLRKTDYLDRSNEVLDRYGI